MINLFLVILSERSESKNLRLLFAPHSSAHFLRVAFNQYSTGIHQPVTLTCECISSQSSWSARLVWDCFAFLLMHISAEI
jgi:hypothetical protein